MSQPPDRTRPGELDVIEEVEDDFIVAQSTVHRPAPRANVTEESRTVVLAADAAEDPNATSRMKRVEPGRNDPTLVLRAVRNVALPLPAPPPPPPKPISMAWLAWIVVGVLALVAFGVGGALALWVAQRESAASEPAPPVPPAPPSTSAR